MRALLPLLLFAACARTPSSPAPSAPQLCVARHGESFRNLDPVPEGLSAEQLDSLTPTGEGQARALRDRLPQPIGLVWASPAGRTQQTARAVALEPELLVVPELRSLDGELPWSERTAAWARGEDPRPPGGESLADGQARVQGLLRRVHTALPPGTHALLVTHSDTAALLLGELRGTPLLERPTRDTLGTGEVTCLPLPPG